MAKGLPTSWGSTYYDKELITEIAKSSSLHEDYVDKVLEKGGFTNFAFSFAHSLPLTAAMPNSVTDVLVAQQNVIKTIAKKGGCVIVGRCADVIASEYNPVRIFVYADEQSKIARCRARERDGEDLTDKKLLKKFKEIDKGREKLHDLLASAPWGAKEAYDIMVNTSRTEIAKIIQPVAELAKILSARI